MPKLNTPKQWTVNVLVNTAYVEQLKGSGRWDKPVGATSHWRKNVTIAAVSDDPSDEVRTGTGDDFVLEVNPRDTIRWVMSEINPLNLKGRAVCMYGFKVQDQAAWDEHLTPLSALTREAPFVAMTRGFNDEHEPTDYLEVTRADISVPTTVVRAGASEGNLKYWIKLLLVDTSKNPRRPAVLKYAQIDPTIKIVKKTQA